MWGAGTGGCVSGAGVQAGAPTPTPHPPPRTPAPPAPHPTPPPRTTTPHPINTTFSMCALSAILLEASNFCICFLSARFLLMWEKALVALTVLLGRALEPSRLGPLPNQCDCTCYCESGATVEASGVASVGVPFWTFLSIAVLISHVLVVLLTRHCVRSVPPVPVLTRSTAGSAVRRRGRGVIEDASR